MFWVRGAEGHYTIKRKTAQWQFSVTVQFLAQREGFEPSCDCSQTDFEGRETAKTALYFRISSYRLSAKSLVNKGFSCILWLWRFFFLQPCFSRPGTIWAPCDQQQKEWYYIMWVMGSHMFRKDIGHHLSIKMIKNMRKGYQKIAQHDIIKVSKYDLKSKGGAWFDRK